MSRVVEPLGPCVNDAPRLILAVLARTILWSALLLATWSCVPSLLGWHVTTVVSGSMSPGILAGDVVGVLPVPVDDLSPGRVLLVDDPDHDDRLRLHRLERVEESGQLRLRGDANAEADRSLVDPSAVHGIGVLRIPAIGLPTVWIRQQEWLVLADAVLLTTLLVMLARADGDIVAGRPCRRCGAPRGDVRTRMRTPGDASVRGPALALVTVAVISLSAAAGAGAGFSGTSSTRAALDTEEFACFHRSNDAAQLAWDFAEKDGDIVRDVSGHGADGRFTGSGADRVDRDCDGNPYGSFTGEGWTVTETAVAAPNEFSIEVWFRTDETAGGRVFGFGSDTLAASSLRDRHLYVDSNGRLKFGLEGAGSQFKFTLTSARVVADGEWHHAVAVFRPGMMTFWVDGVHQSARSDAVSLRQYEGHWRAARQTLAGWPGSGGYAFKGDIDTARVYDRVLDAPTIAAHFAAGR